jgi:hypothetical protein
MSERMSFPRTRESRRPRGRRFCGAPETPVRRVAFRMLASASLACRDKLRNSQGRPGADADPIVDLLNRGVSVPGIAAREGSTAKRESPGNGAATA